MADDAMTALRIDARVLLFVPVEPHSVLLPSAKVKKACIRQPITRNLDEAIVMHDEATGILKPSWCGAGGDIDTFVYTTVDLLGFCDNGRAPPEHLHVRLH